MSRFTDLTGQRFSRLLVVVRTEHKNRNSRWVCICDCGKQTIVDRSGLKSGNTKSCGCLNEESRRNKPRNFRHGYARARHQTVEYSAWNQIHQRCKNPNSKAYKNYGGRGITVCERWNDFVNFLADVGKRPHPSLSIDRINNNGNYEPGNVHWATAKEQANNRRQHAVKITI